MKSHQVRTLLGERAQLVGMRTSLKNQIRGALKTHGFVVSHSVEKGFKAKVAGSSRIADPGKDGCSVAQGAGDGRARGTGLEVFQEIR